MEDQNQTYFIAYVQGDLAAFDLFYQQVSPRIWSFVRKRVSDQALAEDIYQEVWSKIHRARFQYDSKFPIMPWVFTVTRSVLIDKLRSKARVTEDLVAPEVLEQTVAVSETDVEGEVTNAQDWLDQSNLSYEHKRMLELRYLKEWSFEEMGRALGLTEDNVRQKISRILRKLKQGVV